MAYRLDLSEPQCLHLSITDPSDELDFAMSNVPFVEGFWDLRGHCDGRRMSPFIGFPAGSVYSAEDVLHLVRTQSDWQGENIRMLACRAGAYSDGIAQYLASNLGVGVLAPKLDLWVMPNGELYVSDADVPINPPNEGLYSKDYQSRLWQYFY